MITDEAVAPSTILAATDFHRLPSTSAGDASRGSAVRLAAEIVVRLSSIVATLWLTRTLGVAAFGQFVVALSIGLMIAELCDLGLNAIVVPLVVRSPRNLGTIFRMKAAMSGFTLLMSLILIPLSARVSGVAPLLLGLCTIHFLGASWIEVTGTALRAVGRRVDEALLLFTFRFTLVGLVVAAPFGLTVLGASIGYALAIGPAVLLGGWLLHARVISEGPPGAAVRAILRQAAPMGANGYLSILSTRVEVLLIQLTQGEHAVGLFGGALRIVESLLTLPSAIAAGALPAVARDVVRGSRGAAQRTFGLVVWMGVPSAVGLALCAPAVLGVLGPGFVDGATVLRMLSLALFLCFANAAVFHILIAAGDTAIIPRLTGVRVGVACVLGSLVIPWVGLIGAAFSFTTAELCLFVMLVRRARSHAELQVFRPVGWAVVACLPMALILSIWSFSLPVAILTGALLFVLVAGVILQRGTEASGLA
ncbi:MAG: polysaccharide biosynthesis C-terminal domain-containing protein [Vicinamibacteria bacterium]|nr:polysaccharide biosynthesis C-terminal domain-containing protein [Vicinamibacteria bacterium]